MAANCLQQRACDGRPIVDDQSVEQYDQAQVDVDRQLLLRIVRHLPTRAKCPFAAASGGQVLDNPRWRKPRWRAEVVSRGEELWRFES